MLCCAQRHVMCLLQQMPLLGLSVWAKETTINTQQGAEDLPEQHTELLWLIQIQLKAHQEVL